jgi:branched-chain amino acid transport system substrate-binding protein
VTELKEGSEMSGLWARKPTRLAGAVTAITALSVIMAACGNSSPGSNSGQSGSGLTGAPQGVSGDTITVGLQTPLTGFLASSYGSQVVQAAQARIDLAESDGELPKGEKIKLVTADETSVTTGSLSAAQKLIQTDKVYADIVVSSSFYTAYRYAVQQGIPVLALGIDGPEYADPANSNLFSASGSGVSDYPTFHGLGSYFKSQGATKFCAVAYEGAPSSNFGGLQQVASAKADGLAVPYSAVGLPLGSTNFTSVALAMKADGCNAVGTEFAQNGNIALLTALKQDGVNLKASFFVGGYSQAILDDPSAVQVSQGAAFGSSIEPWSLKTPATEAMQNALKKYASWTQPNPTNGQVFGWEATSLFIEGLTQAGTNLSWSNYITKLRAVKNYDTGGLTCPINLGAFGQYIEGGYVGDCAWPAIVKGDAFTSQTNPIKVTPVLGTANNG